MTNTDNRLIHDFLSYFRLTREYWSKAIYSDISEEEITHLLVQIVVLWLFQLNYCFDNDKSYFMNRYSYVKSNENFSGSIYDFIVQFLFKLYSNSDKNVLCDDFFGEIYFTRYMLILEDLKQFLGLNIPDKFFICVSDQLILENKPLFDTLSILNGISRDLHSYIIALLYENLVSSKVKRGSGLYYTPKYVSDHIVSLTIESWIIDNVKREFNVEVGDLSAFIANITSLNVFKYIIRLVSSIKVLDPAVGSGYFIESALECLLDVHHQLWKVKHSSILERNVNGVIRTSPLNDSKSSESDYILRVTSDFLISNSLFGVDINQFALNLTKTRIFMYLTVKYGKIFLKRSDPIHLESNFFHGDFLLDELPFKHKFDVVIANPPYMGESGNKTIFRRLSKKFSEYYEGKMDFWYFFLHQTIDLLKCNGYSTFVTSNYWLTAKGAEKLRERLYRNVSFIRFINFNQNQVFNTAKGVHVNIFTFKKTQIQQQDIECTLFTRKYPIKVNLVEQIPNQLNFRVSQSSIIINGYDPYFHFLPQRVLDLVVSIIKGAKKLKDSDFYVKEGIVTGLNKISKRQVTRYNLPPEMINRGVFILDLSNEYDKSIVDSFDNRELELVKPFYKSSDIHRFKTSIKTMKRILYLDRNKTSIDSVPRIKTHLKNFSRVIQSTLDYPPYLNRPRDSNIFKSPKIVTRQRSRGNYFAYCSYDWYAAQDVYYIKYSGDGGEKEPLKALTAILNSGFAYFWFFWMGKRKGHQLELFGEPLDHFPVCKSFSRYQEVLAILVEYLTFLAYTVRYKEQSLEIINYFELKLVDALVNEMYFSEEDERPLLRQLVESGICNIQFEEWENENYKNKLLDNPDNSRQDRLEKTNFETILNYFYKLKQNETLITEIEKNLISFPFYNFE